MSGLFLTMSTSFCLVLFQRFLSSNGSMPTGLCLLIAGNIDKSIIPSLVTWTFLIAEGIPIVSIPLVNGLLIYEKIKWDKHVKEMSLNLKNASKSIIIRLIVASTLRMYCIDTEALVFMCNGGSSYSFTIHPIFTRIFFIGLDGLKGPLLVYINHINNEKQNASWLSGNPALSMQYILKSHLLDCFNRSN